MRDLYNTKPWPWAASKWHQQWHVLLHKIQQNMHNHCHNDRSKMLAESLKLPEPSKWWNHWQNKLLEFYFYYNYCNYTLFISHTLTLRTQATPATSLAPAASIHIQIYTGHCKIYTLNSHEALKACGCTNLYINPQRLLDTSHIPIQSYAKHSECNYSIL